MYLGHLTQMAAVPIYGNKNPSTTHLFWDPNALDLETWHWRLEPIILVQIITLGMTMTYFYGKSNLVSYAYKSGKRIRGFFRFV